MAQRGARAYIRAVTDFVFAADAPQHSDVIFVPGSGWREHVDLAARLYRAGYAPYVLPSGWHSTAQERFEAAPAFDSEWAWMRHLLLEGGVPDSAILREDRATYTWENAQYSREAIDRAGLRVTRALLCCRAPHARRALMYYQAAFPETEILVCPASVPGLDRNTWWQTAEGRRHVLGEIRRLGDQVNDVFEMAVKRDLAMSCEEQCDEHT